MTRFLTAISFMALGLSATVAWGQPSVPQDAKVTFHEPLSTAGKVIEHLSKSTGVSMQALGRMANETLYINVHDVPLANLMAKIAKVTTGKWRVESGTNFLELDEQAMKAAENAEVSAKAAGIKKSIDEMLKKGPSSTLTPADADKIVKETLEISDKLRKLQNQDTPDQAGRYDEKLMQRSGEIQNESPTGRTMLRALRFIDLTAIARMEPDQRIVFATTPNAMQRSLGSGAEKLLPVFAAESASFDQALAKVPKPQGDDEDGYQYWGLLSTQPLKSQPVKLLVAVTSFGYGAGYNAEVKILDNRGRFVGQNSIGLGQGDMDEYSELYGGSGKADPSIQQEPTIDLSPTTNDMIKAFASLTKNAWDGPGAPNRIPDEIRALIVKPEENDPLSGFVPDCLDFIAKKDNLQVVANVPDSAYMAWFYASSAARFTPSLFKKMLDSFGGLSLTIDHGWYVAAPTKPFDTRKNRIDRSLLGTFLRKVDGDGIHLDDMANFVSKQPTYGFQNMSMFMIYLLSQDMMMYGAYSDIPTLKVYASLTGEQRNILSKGQGIQFGLMSQGQQKLVADLVYGTSGMGQTMSMGMSEMTAAVASESDEFPTEDTGPDFNSEPTEALPNGIPRDGYVTWSSLNEGIAIPVGGKPYEQNPMGPQELGNALAMKENPTLYPWIQENEQPALDKFNFGSRLTLSFSFNFTPKIKQDRSLTDIRKDRSKVYGYKDLPEDFRKQVEKAKAELVKSMKDMNQEGGGGENGGDIPPRLR